MTEPQFGIPNIALAFRRKFGIEITRYAFHSNPWGYPTDGRTELTCQDCRDEGMPLRHDQWHYTGISDIIKAMIRHEKEDHADAAALETVA